MRPVLYIGMYIHIYTHIYVHVYTSQKECLHIFWCDGVFVLCLWWRFCGGVLVVVFLWWCGVVLE